MVSYVYILANRKNGALYTGVTSELSARVYQHKEGTASKHTTKYGIDKLVWYGDFEDIRDAIDREHQIKKWRRAWKIKLIEENNPNWQDLYFDLNN